MTALLRSPAFARARAAARSWAHDHLDRPVASATRVAGRVRAGTDVLYLGDSTMIHISADDADRRRLGEMFVAETGLRTAAFYGPAYPPAVFAELLRLLEPLPRPRAIVVSMPIRPGTHLHVTRHPVFGYAHAIETMRRARTTASLPVRLLRPQPTSADYDRFYAVRRSSRWSGERRIGDFRHALRGIDARTASEPDLRLMWDYFHGEFSDGSPGLADWGRFAQQVKRLGVPLIAYRAHMPYEYGSKLFGPAFVEHVEHNYALIEAELTSRLAGDLVVLDVPPPPDAHFIQPQDGTEHWNEHGRRALVGRLGAALKDVLD